MEQRNGIQKRVLKALRYVVEEDLEAAFFHLAPVVDSTSKRHYPQAKSQKARYCDYLHKHKEDLFLIATHGSLMVHGGFGNPLTKEVTTLAEAIYKVRCASVHDPEEQSAIVCYTNEGRWGFDKEGRFHINRGMLIAMALLVLTDPSNRPYLDRHELARFGILRHGNVVIDLTACIGGRSRVLAAYRKVKERKLQRIRRTS